MTNEERINLAVEKKHNANNCAQAVIFAFQDKLSLTDEEIKKLGAPFGLGMGKMEGNCGALIGAEIVKGLLSNGAPMHKEAHTLFTFFKNKAGATICKELKGVDTGKILTPCDKCVEIGVRGVLEAI